MTSYIGGIERLLPLLYPESAESFTKKLSEPFTVQEAPNATWAFVNSPVAGGRAQSWDNTYKMLHADYSTLEGMVQGAHGWRAFTFIPESAALTNVLSPAQSLLSGVANAGWADTVQGGSPASLVGGNSVTVVDKVPIIPGKWVTVSLDVAGESMMTVEYCNASGGVMFTKEVRSDGTLMQRLAASNIAPVTSRYVRIRVKGHTVAACPQVTFTQFPVPWSVGGASTSVIITDLSSTSSYLDPRTNEMWRTVSLSVREVGAVG